MRDDMTTTTSQKKTTALLLHSSKKHFLAFYVVKASYIGLSTWEREHHEYYIGR